MCHKISTLIAIVLFFFAIALPQTVKEQTKSEAAIKLEKDAVEFLRDTLAEVNNMRSLENRISFGAEIASLMWYHDEREARGMFGGVINDFENLLRQYDTQMNAQTLAGSDESFSGGLFGDLSDKSRIERKFRTAMGVRQRIAASIAEHDPELAFGFYYNSLLAISNPKIRKEMETRDKYFETQLISQVAEKNAAKAVQFARRSLESGFDNQHVEILKKIYAKDADRGAEFGADVLSRIKGEKPEKLNLWVATSLLEWGSGILDASRRPGGKKPVYIQADLRDMADTIAQSILSRPNEEGFSGAQYASLIEKFSPGRGAQIRARFSGRRSDSNSRYAYGANAMNTAANAMARATNTAGYDSSNSNSISDRDRERENRERGERQMMEDVMRLGNKQIPKEQRESIIAQARKILMLTPGREKKITGLSLLAAQVASAGDKELAAEIMKDAQGLVSTQPKNYRDFLLTWMLATGYAAADPDKAFPLLEDTISRANDTISAFIKVGEFMDANEEVIADGEVQLGAFGGSMVRGLTGELGMADNTIQQLAKVDFARTRDLTNKFDRAEVRVLAKMMVLRAILGPKAASKVKNAVSVDGPDTDQ